MKIPTSSGYCNFLNPRSTEVGRAINQLAVNRIRRAERYVRSGLMLNDSDHLQKAKSAIAGTESLLKKVCWLSKYLLNCLMGEVRGSIYLLENKLKANIS